MPKNPKVKKVERMKLTEAAHQPIEELELNAFQGSETSALKELVFRLEERVTVLEK